MTQRHRMAWSGPAGVRQRLRDGRRASAALEFALVFPVMIALMFGMTDGCLGLMAYRQVTIATEEIALIATELSVQSNGTTSLTTTQLFQAGTAIFGVMQSLEAAGSAQPFAVTVSAIVFKGSPNGCSPTACTSFTANVAWSVPLSSFASTGQYLGWTTPSAPVRKCGTVTQVAQTTAATLTTIPTLGMTNLSSVLVVDLQYSYLPLFTQVFVGSTTFTHTAFLPPRLAPPAADPQYVAYDLANDTTDQYICSGYQ